MGVTIGVSVLLAKTSGIVHREGEALSARHPVYIEHLFEIAVTREEKAAAIRGLLEAFTAYAKPLRESVGRAAWSLFKLTINHGFLRNTLQGDSALVLSVYEAFARAFQEDALFWLQYGLALRQAGMQEEALEKLKMAVEAYPMKQTEHAYAQQQLILALGTTSKAKAYTYLQEAKEVLTRLDSLYHDEEETDYPLVTLSEHHTEIVAKFEGHKKGRDVAKDYANILQQRIKKGAVNPRLRQAWKRLALYATTGTLEPK
jgi:tetratricopeptide (TPR) repeat protein